MNNQSNKDTQTNNQQQQQHNDDDFANYIDGKDGRNSKGSNGSKGSKDIKGPNKASLSRSNSNQSFGSRLAYQECQ